LNTTYGEGYNPFGVGCFVMNVTKISYFVKVLNLIGKVRGGEKSGSTGLNKRTPLPIVRPQTIPA
ncbi:hypothetical protein, partial [Citrobacter freundii]|uniref:hypothetical protein n=1 Tax=Citrobacter freundii TaxID=546 RepID=UPI001D11C0DC